VELFHGIIDTGFLYRFRIQDSCGRNDTINYVPRFVSFNLGDSLISCRDFTVFPNPHVIYTPPVLYTVYDQGIFVDSSSADQPTFYHLPPGIYQVTASQALCHPNTVTVSLPGLRGACLVPMMDSTCTPSYAVYQSIVTTREHFSLVSTTNSSVYWQKEPSPYSNAAVFVSVPVGSYNLVSDSGCTVPFPLPAFAHTVSAISTRQCTGQALITATVTPPIRSCNSAQGGYITLLKDNQYIASQNIGTGSTAQFMVSDTGYYVVRLFLSNTTDFTLDATFDTICPLDTVLVYVDNNALPNIIAKQVILVCGNVTTNIPYTIFGGTAPYTVQILGYPTRYVPTTHDTFPNVAVGVYTMIVSDSCGISRSFSVSVIDTCSTVCTVNSQFSLNTALVCTSGVVNLQNLSSGASHYRWDINGSIYAYGSDTSFVAFPGNSYTIRLYAYVGICVDSFIVTFIDTCHPVCAVHSRFSVNDSLTCTNQTVTLHNLSTGATSYRWDINGTLYSHATDTSITAAPDSSYTIRLYADSGICVDSFIVTFIDTCHPACTVHSQFAISDTLTCVNVLVSTQNQSTGATSYQWDINGTIYSTATDTSFASSVSGADTIKLYAYKGACIDSSTKTITIIDAVSGAARQDISLCAPFSLQLNSHIANTLWSNTIADSVITVTTPGLYQATVSNGCSSAIDTFNVAEYPGITGFSLTDSKVTICSDRPDTVTVAASIDSGQRSVVFIWSTGQRDSAVYRSDVTSYLSGTYDVTADNGYCPQTRTISIAEAPCDSSCINNFAIPDIFSPNGDRMNDTFFLPHVCNLSPFAMHIYNQWGELVFESQDINQGWDGKYKGKEQPEGVYWLWLMITPGKATIYLSRTVTLVR
jgi:gliding motility-associated-like protein